MQASQPRRMACAPGAAARGGIESGAVTCAPRLLAACLLLAAPVAVVQKRGLVPLAALAAAALLLCLWPRRRELGARMLRGSFAALCAALVALSLWAGVSALWAVVPGDALAGALRLAGLAVTLFLVLAAASLADSDGARLIERAILASALGLAALIVVELLADAPLNNALRGFPDPPRSAGATKPAATLLAVFSGPAVLAAWRLGGLGVAFAVAAPFAAAVAVGTSQSAKLALAAASAAAAAALAAPALLRRALPLALALAVLAGPSAVYEVSKAATRAGLLPFSAVHRTVIWDHAAERAAERPLGGFGMDASRSLPGGRDRPEAERLDRLGVSGAIRDVFLSAPPGAIELIPLHTHSMPLQVRLELGLVGLGLTALFAYFAGRAAAALPERAALAAGAAVAASAAVVSLLSYGVWQHWWWVAVGLAAVPLAAARAACRRG